MVNRLSGVNSLTFSDVQYMQKIYRKSIFVHNIPNSAYLWNAAKGCSIKLPTEMKKLFLEDFSTFKLKYLNSPFFKKLQKHSFILTNIEEKRLINQLKQKTKDTYIKGLYLILTTSCNLQCKYCFYQTQKKYTQTKMSESTVLDAINLYASQMKSVKKGDENFFGQITFYGGEPLLNQNILKKAVTYVRFLQKTKKLSKKIALVVNTNGTLITKEFAKFSKKYNLQIQISIDGTKPIHDANRITAFGEGSFKNTLRGLQYLSEENADILPLITVTDENMKEMPSFITQLVKKYHLKHYGMNLLMNISPDINEIYPKKAAEIMLKTISRTQKYGAVDSVIIDTINTIRQNKLQKNNCGAARKIVVFPNGKLHTCQALHNVPKTFLGNLKQPPVFFEAFQDWRTLSRFNREECLNCPAVRFCGSGCIASAYNRTSDITEKDFNYCHWFKNIFEKYFKVQKFSIK